MSKEFGFYDNDTGFSGNNVIQLKQKINHDKIIEKREILNKVSKQLKSEFFGLDEVIDKIIKAISAWYIFPEIITRPVIINLWGMTGVGKTSLIRRLVSLLKFGELFVEVQMDGGNSNSNYSISTLTKLLSSSTIEEGTPGILLLDEIQRFRTVDEQGNDVPVERFHDVWTLLSDGKFSADSDMFMEIEMMLACREWEEDAAEEAKPEQPAPAKKKVKPVVKKERSFKMYPFEAKSLKKLLRLQEPIAEIMKWDTTQILIALDQLKSNRITWEIDYTKLLIFISGNLDSAFVGSDVTDDCDTDADFYHEQTKKITSTDIKRNLQLRFRPEQVSRLGNNHIIYPSMSKKSYEQLIKTTCQKYLDEMSEVSDIKFTLDDSICQEIYNNSVYPTQGTRPVFSSIHLIFSSILVETTFWALEQDTKEVLLKMSPDGKNVTVYNLNTSASVDFPIDLELNLKRSKTTLDSKTLVAVHEAGHTYVYAKLMKSAPMEIKINTASYEGGYMLPTTANTHQTKQYLLDEIAILLAGTAIEEVVFGRDKRSYGASSDIQKATKTAHDIVRQYGLHNTLAMINCTTNGGVSWVTDLENSNIAIEEILQQEYKRAKEIIVDGMPTIRKIVNSLLKMTTIQQSDLIELVKPDMELLKEIPDYHFNADWKTFWN